MKKLLKSKKGVTLMEIIVGIMLFSIVLIAVSSILVPMIQVYAKANDLAEYNTLLDNLANPIIKDLSQATSKIVNEGGSSQNGDPLTIIMWLQEVEYTVEGGVLKKNGNPVLSEAYYKKKSVSFSWAQIGSGTETIYKLTVTLSLKNNDGTTTEAISRAYTVKPICLNQYSTD